jgi:hypothetical protein
LSTGWNEIRRGVGPILGDRQVMDDAPSGSMVWLNGLRAVPGSLGPFGLSPSEALVYAVGLPAVNLVTVLGRGLIGLWRLGKSTVAVMPAGVHSDLAG